jgi:hypothetical protein
VNVLVGALVVLGLTALTVTAMLLVRRRAPEGSYFSDGDRASGVFGALATGFSVLLGFIIFLSFASYDEARSGAEEEAIILAQQVETAQFLPEAQRVALTGQLLCYGRSVVGTWSALEAGALEDTLNPWGSQLFRTIRSVDPQSEAEQSAYDRWMDQTAAREQARNERIHGAQGIIPVPLWIVLFVTAGVILVYMMFFADSGERAVTQALLMGSVTVVIAFSVVLLVFFNRPYGEGLGELQPTAMQRSLRLIDAELDVAGLGDLKLPCDVDGRAI